MNIEIRFGEKYAVMSFMKEVKNLEDIENFLKAVQKASEALYALEEGSDARMEVIEKAK